MSEIEEKINEMNELYEETGLNDDVIDLLIEINELQESEEE